MKHNLLLFLSFFVLIQIGSSDCFGFAPKTENVILSEDTIIPQNAVTIDNGISYYPNPIRDVFNLDLSKSKIKYHTVILSNVFGKEMAKEDISALPPAKQSLILIQTQSFPSGMYFVTLIGTESRKTFRISKEN